MDLRSHFHQTPTDPPDFVPSLEARSGSLEPTVSPCSSLQLWRWRTVSLVHATVVGGWTDRGLAIGAEPKGAWCP